jgi:branched-chain amino acid transport system substrate-binding protein
MRNLPADSDRGRFDPLPTSGPFEKAGGDLLMSGQRIILNLPSSDRFRNWLVSNLTTVSLSTVSPELWGYYLMPITGWSRRRGAMRLQILSGLTLALLATTLLGGTAEASSSGLVPGHGNASGGALVSAANAIAKNHLIGPKGTGLTRGVTSSTITIGCVYTAASYQGYQQGIQARLDQVNKGGGVDGRTVKLIPCEDDANSQQTNVTDNEDLVNQDQVFSVLTLSQWELNGSTNFLNQNQVPYFGWGYSPPFCGYRWGFGWNGCLGGNGFQEPIEAVASSLAEPMIKATGLPTSKVRLAVEGVNAQAGEIGDTQYVSDYEANGSGVDNTPYVSAIMASKPNVVILSIPFASVSSMAASLKAAGYKGAIMDFTNYLPGLLQSSAQLASALQGEYVNTQVVPDEENTSYIKTIDSALAAEGQPQFVTLGGFMGYAEADMLVQMLQAVGKNLNTATFDKIVNGGSFASFKHTTGGPGALVWPAAHYLPADCSAIVQVSGTEYKVIRPFGCYNSFKVTTK